MINRNAEAVGLIFDGNIESLPGAFIYEPTKNRTVSVHAGGIIAAMKYVYKADRIVTELTNAPGMQIKAASNPSANNSNTKTSKTNKKSRKK
jgi:hypothetical protein